MFINISISANEMEEFIDIYAQQFVSFQARSHNLNSYYIGKGREGRKKLEIQFNIL